MGAGLGVLGAKEAWSVRQLGGIAEEEMEPGLVFSSRAD